MSYLHYEGNLLIQSHGLPIRVLLDEPCNMYIVRIKAHGKTAEDVKLKVLNFIRHNILSQHDYTQDRNFERFNLYTAIVTFAEGLKCSDYVTSVTTKDHVIDFDIDEHDTNMVVL